MRRPRTCASIFDRAVIASAGAALFATRTRRLTGFSFPDMPMPRTSRALDNLRAVVIVIIVAFHSVIAYVAYLPATPYPFDAPPYLWTTFPIIDSARWFGFDLFCAFEDIHIIALMYLLSGLFVWPSLARKGRWGFLRDRMLRLGVPFALVVGILMPLTHYATYRV